MQSLRWIAACWVACCALVLVAQAWAQGEAQSAAPGARGGLVVVRLEGELSAGMRSLLARALDQAEQRGARVVLELDTPGGSIERMRELAAQLDEASRAGIPSAAWVNGQAWSAGAFLALACDKLYLRSGSSIGSATPAQLGINEQGALELMPVSDDPELREKFFSAFRAEFRALAERQGRPGALAEAMVDPKVGVRLVDRDGERVLLNEREWEDALARGEDLVLLRTVVNTETALNLTAAEAVELGLADGLAEDLAALAQSLGESSNALVSIDERASDRFAALADQWSGALLLLALVLAFVELKTPGFGLAGGGALACLALLLAGRYLSGVANALEILAVAAGLVLVAVEVFLMPGALWPGICGVLLALSGLFFSEMPPGFSLLDEAGRQRALAGAFELALAVSVALVAMTVLSRFLHKAPVVGRMVLAGGPAGEFTGAANAEDARAERRRPAMGARGRALTPLRPVGKVELDGEPGREYEASCEGAALERGALVRVLRASGERVWVEELREG